MIHVVAVDRSTLDDLMAWQTIARALAGRAPRAGGVVLLHAPGEPVERMLEGRELELRGPDGFLRAMDAVSSEALEQAVRSDNRRIAALLTEEGVPAVGFVGGDRGLLGAGAPPTWLEAVIRTGSIPVVASVSPGPGGLCERGLDEAVSWFSGLPGAVPVLLAAAASGRPEGLSARDRGIADRLEDRGLNVTLSTIYGLAALGGRG